MQVGALFKFCKEVQWAKVLISSMFILFKLEITMQIVLLPKVLIDKRK